MKKICKICENDLIEVVESQGLVENGFGKKRFQFKVIWNGKEKILSANQKQFQQLQLVI